MVSKVEEQLKGQCLYIKLSDILTTGTKFGI